MRKYYYLQGTIKELLLGVNNSDLFTRTKLAAFVVHKKRIVSIGFNQYKTNPIQVKFGKNKHSLCIHAEVSALRRAEKLIDNKRMNNSILFVGRIKKKRVSPEIELVVSGLSFPCEGCQRAIKHFGIKKVIYSLDDSDEYGVWEVK